MNPILLIIGTRPEGIKMAPVYFALKQACIPTVLCSTSQHTNLLSEVYKTFNFAPDIELNVMKHNQDLFHITNQVLQKTKDVYQQIKPQLVLVHGDTTTAMAATLSAFYLGIPVGHVEAGLRTETIHSPFPEEMNRRFVDMTATYHFAPTQQAVKNLQQEKIDDKNIFYTGNTIVDALRIMREKISTHILNIDTNIQTLIQKAQQGKQQIVLITVHRRESLHGGIKRILETLKIFALQNTDIVFIYPYHPNPHIMNVIKTLSLSEVDNIFLCAPLMYKELLYILQHAHWIATDSGGIQEEAVSLGKRVIVFREYTERPEGIWEGLATLVGTNCNKILQAFKKEKQQANQNNIANNNIYGDGYAADKIVGIIQKIVIEKKKELNEQSMHHGSWIYRSANSNHSSRT